MVIGVLIAALLPACKSTSSVEAVGMAPVAGGMPALGGSLLAGGYLGPEAYRGKIVVVNFWNYDCGPCRREQPALEAEWRRLQSQGVMVVGVLYTGGGWPDSISTARTYLHWYGVSYPTISDPGAALATAFAIPGIPTTVIADASGHLRYRKLGPVDPGQLQAAVAKVRSGPSPAGT
jgi:peroxiredoxin